MISLMDWYLTSRRSNRAALTRSSEENPLHEEADVGPAVHWCDVLTETLLHFIQMLNLLIAC